MTAKHFLLLTITLLNIFNIQAANSQKDSHEDEIEFTNISIQEGLSESVVLASCQDKMGHMWFATQDGVNRYNGYDFTVYRNESEDSTSIADNISRPRPIKIKRVLLSFSSLIPFDNMGKP